MSQALATRYDCRPPAVIYNAFPWSDRACIDGLVKDRKDRSIPSLHWFSQTIGIGRGLEDLFAALPNVKSPMEFHLRGNLIAGGQAWLSRQVPPEWASRIFLHPIVSNTELLSRISEHDIGYAGEGNDCRSRDLTVTNKLLHYLLGGLAVVASGTAGQREVAEQAPGAVRLFRAGRPGELAAILNSMLEDKEGLCAAKAAALEAAEHSFCWEKVAPVLVGSVQEALARHSVPQFGFVGSSVMRPPTAP